MGGIEEQPGKEGRRLHSEKHACPRRKNPTAVKAVLSRRQTERGGKAFCDAEQSDRHLAPTRLWKVAGGYTRPDHFRNLLEGPGGLVEQKGAVGDLLPAPTVVALRREAQRGTDPQTDPGRTRCRRCRWEHCWCCPHSTKAIRAGVDRPITSRWARGQSRRCSWSR